MLAGDDRPAVTVPFVVWLLIAANLFVFVQELRSPAPTRFVNAFAAVPYNLTHGIVLPPPSPPTPLLTVITAMFVHGGVAHIALNMLFLLVFGPTVEDVCGHAEFLGLYLACGIAGEAAQVLVGPGSHLPAIGASGAIAGVLGAYLVERPRKPVLGFPAIVVIGVWALAQFANGFGELSEHAVSAGGIAYFAHIGGFCCGVLTIGVFRRPTAGMHRRPW